MKFSVAIVTGGNKGIGYGITKLLLKNNYKVITCGRSGFEDLDKFNGLDHIQGDITNYETHRNLVEQAINSYGKLDLYVNNVGISKWKAIEEINNDFLDNLFKTNIYSVFWGCKAAQKYLQKTL
jgi:NAD(P)-dependent dehydrogenase (short-subunit alcohol dehydrogenase family)